MNNTLTHHGILGQKWGVRRYQNKDGTLTTAGRKRYGRTLEKLSILSSDSSTTKKVKSDYNNLSDSDFLNKYFVKKEKYAKRVEKYGDPYAHNKKRIASLEQLERKIANNQSERAKGEAAATKLLGELEAKYGRKFTLSERIKEGRGGRLQQVQLG